MYLNKYEKERGVKFSKELREAAKKSSASVPIPERGGWGVVKAGPLRKKKFF